MLAQSIRENFPCVPVLLATGYSSAAERAGQSFPILRKPYEAETLWRRSQDTLNLHGLAIADPTRPAGLARALRTARRAALRYQPYCL